MKLAIVFAGVAQHIKKARITSVFSALTFSATFLLYSCKDFSLSCRYI